MKKLVILMILLGGGVWCFAQPGGFEGAWVLKGNPNAPVQPNSGVVEEGVTGFEEEGVGNYNSTKTGSLKHPEGENFVDRFSAARVASIPNPINRGQRVRLLNQDRLTMGMSHHVDLLDINGKKFAQIPIVNGTLNVSTYLEPGFYLAVIRNEQELLSTRKVFIR